MDLTMDVPVFYGCPCFSQRLEDWLGIGDYRDVIFTSLFRRNYNWDTSPFVRDLVLRILSGHLRQPMPTGVTFDSIDYLKLVD